jgi:hypothetical protein
MKRTTKTERRRARRAWGGACQEFGTAWAARVGRDRNHHLPLRVASALRIAPWHLFDGVPKPPGGRRYPVVAILTESWPQAARVRWTRRDTYAWYVEEATMIIHDEDTELAPWLEATEHITAELWTRGPYSGA